MDFRFLPTELTSRCSQLIKVHHGAKGYWSLPEEAKFARVERDRVEGSGFAECPLLGRSGHRPANGPDPLGRD